MTTLDELKHKYSGQPIPDWEFAKINAEDKAGEPVVEKKKPGRPKKTVEPEEVSQDGDGN